MQIRSQTMRLNCAVIARLASAMLVALSIFGCQSNSERDLMARDRRMQEDQMWAMQDYIQQYQQLVCQFRSENASLRRQLNDERGGPVVERGSQPVPHPSAGTPTNNAPNLQNPPAPGMDQKPVPPPNMDKPDVPPLGQGASIDAGSWTRSYVESVGRQRRDRYAQLASYEAPVNNMATPPVNEPSAPSTFDNDSPSISSRRDRMGAVCSPEVLLSGEVVIDDNGSGPRLVIEIESFDESGRFTKFDGAVSLALLASDEGVQRRIARWDFGPEDIRAAVDTTTSKQTMRFHVELPAGTQIMGATELWAKLASSNGARLFSHAKLNLAKPGVFTSRSDKAWASEESVVGVSYVDTSTPPAESITAINESEWSTARPGKPAILPPESDNSAGGWKAANGPIPVIIANAKSRETFDTNLPRPVEILPTKTAPAEVVRKPSWKPERPGAPSPIVRPTWSPSR